MLRCLEGGRFRKIQVDEDARRSVEVGELDEKTWELSVKNPSVEEEAPLRDPQEIIAEIRDLSSEADTTLSKTQKLIS